MPKTVRITAQPAEDIAKAYLDGKSRREIAETTECSYGSVCAIARGVHHALSPATKKALRQFGKPTPAAEPAVMRQKLPLPTLRAGQPMATSLHTAQQVFEISHDYMTKIVNVLLQQPTA